MRQNFDNTILKTWNWWKHNILEKLQQYSISTESTWSSSWNGCRLLYTIANLYTMY